MDKESIHPGLIAAGLGGGALAAHLLAQRARRRRVSQERPDELPGEFRTSPGFSSSNVASASYNPRAGVMEVGFNSGGTYRYFDVPPRVWKGFLNADSKGSYLHKKVKMPGYSYEKISSRLFRRLDEIEKTSTHGPDHEQVYRNAMTQADEMQERIRARRKEVMREHRPSAYGALATLAAGALAGSSLGHMAGKRIGMKTLGGLMGTAGGIHLGVSAHKLLAGKDTRDRMRSRVAEMNALRRMDSQIEALQGRATAARNLRPTYFGSEN